MSAPKLQFREATETSILVEFQPVDSNVIYLLQWKEHPQTWDNARSIELKAGTVKAEAADLEPGMTYCVRLTVKDGSVEPGPELIVDTEQVGCTPKADKGCCVVT